MTNIYYNCYGFILNQYYRGPLRKLYISCHWPIYYALNYGKISINAKTQYKKIFTYYNDEFKKEDDSFSIHISSDLDTPENLINHYYRYLGYEGDTINWEAFDDNVTGIEFTESKYTYYIHDQLPKLKKRDLEIYISILFTAICSRHSRYDIIGTDLIVAFHKQHENKINKIIKKYITSRQISPYYESHPWGYY
ncbi:uncharacterized protein DFE_2670 [Desulfovibrio ferrophilus]|uniref:Uncharacterized protein n=1 Tax=Desulfovibrio ferrophilus TaxID=241368 RepID=A0A2Z6B1X7_9BACT|nr:uncharacterized protein DFE_2670 [Desulfovibrio ferrophilus]